MGRRPAARPHLSLRGAAYLTRVLARTPFQFVRKEIAGPLLSTSSLSRTGQRAQVPHQVTVSAPRADQRESGVIRQFGDRGPIDLAA